MPPSSIGPYRIMSTVGVGGMGTVYRAEDRQSHQVVALKVLHPHLAQSSDYLMRFRREVRIARELDSPNIVKLLDAGEFDGSHYIVMEFVEGLTLTQRLNSGPRLAIEEAVSIARQIGIALVEAHRHGIIHRDISPQNILIDAGSIVKVADFGIARDSADAVTATATFLGKPQYSSPEQWAGRVDIRSDLYSLGILLYEMLSGTPPFNAPTPLATLRMHEQTPPRPVGDLRAGIPVALQQVVHRCLAKRPDSRFQTPTDFLSALANATGITPPLPAPQQVRRSSTSSEVRPTGVKSKALNPLLLLAVAGGGAVLILGTVLAVALGSGTTRTSQGPSVLAPTVQTPSPPATSQPPTLIPPSTPPPLVSRTGQAASCAGGSGVCTVSYVIGPVTRVGQLVRIEFSVGAVGPANASADWTSDLVWHAEARRAGQRGIVLIRADNPAVFYELYGATGQAASGGAVGVGRTYSGTWEFAAGEPPGTLLLLSYPDFPNDPVPIYMPPLR